jgi:dienelactone hydrolase
VHKEITEAHSPARLARALLLGALLLGGNAVLAKEKKVTPPDETGPYSIGHTTVILTDTSRNLDGSTPVDGDGRFLYLDIWYPTDVVTDARILYDWNNPLYNENPGGLVYPGLPDLPPMTWDGSVSTNPIAEGAALAREGKFPLLVASHGNLVASAKNMPDTLEMLASHGYVIASIEHTGNNDAQYQASLFNNPFFLNTPVGPNPTLGDETILQRSKDVSFIIDAVLDGLLDQATGIEFTGQIDEKAIGVLGFSLGGMTSLATVTGIGAQGHPADHRVKAALMGGGSNYGLLLDTDDYANAEVPLMFLGNDTGIVYDKFNEFTGTKIKYHVDIADFNHHIGGYQNSWCQDFQSSMEAVNPDVFPTVFFAPETLDPSDLATYGFTSTFYWIYTGTRNSGVYDYCEPSTFDNLSDEVLVDVLFGSTDILAVRDELIGSMPLKPEASIAEITRTTNWYAVAFFNSTLKQEKGYKRYLTDSKNNERANPLVELEVDCFKEKPHPIDLSPSDKLTFVPVGDSGYEVSLTAGASLYDTGTAIDVAGDAVAYLSYPGFSFPVPGMADPVENIFVNENGVISTRTTADISAIDDNGSPWYMKGHLLLSAQFTIGALMKDLTSMGDDVFAYYDDVEDRVVITYLGVPAAGTTEPNTLQIAIHGDGKIEMIIGELADTGANYSPSILGTLGIAGGYTRIDDLRKVEATDLSELRDNGSKFIPFGPEDAIFEQFYSGTERSCKGKGGD